MAALAEALGHSGRERVPERETRGVPDHYRQCPLGEIGDGADLTQRFQREVESLSGNVFVEESARTAGDRLKALLADLSPRGMVSWGRNEFAGLDIGWLWEEMGCVEFTGDPAAFRRAALAADVGITTAEAAVANTGTLVLSTSRSRPRSVSLTPVTHIALVRSDQLVARLGDALARPGGMPSGLFCVSGPSWTADIENDLALGAHGPAEVHIVLWKP